MYRKRIIAVLLAVMMLAAVSAWAKRPAGEVYEPREDNTGYIGYDGKSWGYGYFNSAVIDTATITTATITSLTATTTRTIYFDLGAAAVDGGNDIDDGSAPNLTTVDNVQAILWDDSGETTAVQWTFPVPADYSTGMVFYAMISSDDASGAATKLDWALTQNKDATAFGSPTAQDLVASTESALNTKNDILTLTPDATGAALFVDGAVITLEVFNASTNDDDLELKAIWGEYTATQ